LLSDTLHALLVDSRGRVWVGTLSGLNCIEDGRIISYAGAPGLARGAVYALYEGTDGSIFVGTSGGGLSRFRDWRFVTCTTAEGLSDDVINQIVVDDRDDIWMGHPRGVSRIPPQRRAARRAAEHRQERLRGPAPHPAFVAASASLASQQTKSRPRGCSLPQSAMGAADKNGWARTERRVRAS
jgi:hypothetical protein